MPRPGAIPTIWGALTQPRFVGQKAWRGLRQNRALVVTLFIAVMVALLAIILPLLPLADPLATDYQRTLQPPGADHILGTDLHGRDVFSRVMWAMRPSLLVGLVATAIALATGVLVGGLAGFGGRAVDVPLMRIADIFLSFPVIIGAIAVMAIVGPGLRNIFLAIALFGWPAFARLFRASVLSVRERTYVKAARVMGASERNIFLHHILPNSIGALVPFTALGAAAAILAEAGLSFVNLGVQRPHPSWGLMLAESRLYFEQAPWLVIAPGLAVTLTALLFIMISSAASRAIESTGFREGA